MEIHTVVKRNILFENLHLFAKTSIKYVLEID